MSIQCKEEKTNIQNLNEQDSYLIEVICDLSGLVKQSLLYWDHCRFSVAHQRMMKKNQIPANEPQYAC